MLIHTCKPAAALKSRSGDPSEIAEGKTMNEKEGGAFVEGVALWGGLECTVNRVENQYFSQMDRNGHAERICDLDRFASLGIRAIRYPVLWENTAPDGLDQADWSWPDARLPELQARGITPIVGLVHHGSGPMHTSLGQRPRFPPPVNPRAESPQYHKTKTAPDFRDRLGVLSGPQ